MSSEQMRQLLVGRAAESAALLADLARRAAEQPASLSLDALPQMRTALGRLADDLAFLEAELGNGEPEQRLARIAETLGIGKAAARTRYGHGPQALPMAMVLAQLDLERRT